MIKDGKIKGLAKIAIPVYLSVLIMLAGSCSSTTASNPDAALSANTANSNTQKTEQRISLFEGRFSFVLPEGFKQLPAAEVKRALPDNTPRDHIYSNANQTAYIIIQFDKEMPLEPAQLAEVKRFTEGLHKNYSGWKTSEIIELNGRQWFYFEWEKPVPSNDLEKLVAPVPVEDEPDGNSNVNTVKEKNKPEVKEVKEKKPIYYRSYTTSLNKQMFSISFEADSDEYPKVKEAINKTVQTIQIKD